MVGEFVDDDYFVVVYDVVYVMLVDCVCVQGGVEVVDYGQVLCCVQVFGFVVEDVGFDQQLFGVFYVCFGQVYLFVFFVDLEIVFVVFCFLFDQVWYDVVDMDVQFWGIVGWIGDDQWGMCFVDQDGVDFVDDGVVQVVLVVVGFGQCYVVVQVVEIEFVVGVVGDVRGVGFVFVVVWYVWVYYVYVQVQLVVQFVYLCGVVVGQVVVYGDYVYVFVFQCVEVYWQGCYQGFVFIGVYFCDFVQVKYYVVDQLYVVVVYVQYVVIGFVVDCECFWQYFVQGFIVSDVLFEFWCFGLKLFVGQFFDFWFQCIDFGDDVVELVQLLFVMIVKYVGKQVVDY